MRAEKYNMFYYYDAYEIEDANDIIFCNKFFTGGNLIMRTRKFLSILLLFVCVVLLNSSARFAYGGVITLKLLRTEAVILTTA